MELSEKAVSDFFEARPAPRDRSTGGFRRYRVAGITLLQGDFFALQAEHLAQCRAFYDRAALIALPPEMRERYAGHLQAVLPTRSLGLLVTIDYPQAEMAGPPFAVPDEEVRGYYAGGWRIEELERGDVLGVNWKFLERGVSWLNEAVYLLREAETGAARRRPFSAEFVDQHRKGAQDVLAEPLGAGAGPAGPGLRVVVVVLERHLDGERQAVVGLPDEVAGQRQVGLARRTTWVAMADLEFAARHQFLAEALLESFQAGRIARVALAAGGEYVGISSSPWMSRNRSTPWRFISCWTNQTSGLRSALGSSQARLRSWPAALVRRLPWNAPSGFMFGTRYRSAFSSRRCISVSSGRCRLDQAFHEPFGHVLAGMLLGDDPQLQVAVGMAPDPQQFDVAALHAGADGEPFDALDAERTFDQAGMPFAAVGLEVGEADFAFLRFKLEMQAVGVVLRRYAEPAFAIVRGDCLVAAPGMAVGRLAGVDQGEAVLGGGSHALDEVEPLEMLAGRSGRIARRIRRGSLASMTWMLPLSKSARICMGTSSGEITHPHVPGLARGCQSDHG